MPEEPEIETQDLQEHVAEAHEHAAKDGASWTRYVALSTAAFAAFAAVGALHAGSLVNNAMMDQIRAADAWNEYQADKLKAHTYTIEENRLLDAGATPKADDGSKRPKSESATKSQPLSSSRGGGGPEERRATGGEGKTDGEKVPLATKKAAPLVRKSPEKRLAEYEAQAAHELEKSGKLSDDAHHREHMAEVQLESHERFAYSVALLQVAIALGAVSAIARSKSVWVASAAVGVLGIVFFVIGFVK